MANRDEYIAKMKAQLDEWNADLGKLEDKMEAASDATKERLAPYLENVRDARDAAWKKLGELKNSGEASWDSLEGEVEHVWKTFKQSVNYFKSQL
jgi:predicted  nucleic acid-binding Zn-ribbon protein